MGEASAETAAAGWEVVPTSYPSHLKPGTRGYILLAVYNVGGANSKGQFTVTDRLPAGVTATEAGYRARAYVQAKEEGQQWECSVGTVVTCTNDAEGLPAVPPGEQEWLAIAVEVSAGASGSGVNEITVTGGGAQQPTDVTEPIEFSSTSPSGGFARMDSWFSNEDGTIDTQAGGHPYSLTASFYLNNFVSSSFDFETGGDQPTEEMRNITFSLPRGLVGNPTAAPACTRAELNSEKCPADSQIGIDRSVQGGPFPLYPFWEEEERPPIEAFGTDFVISPQLPVYNMVPPPGVPAEFAFLFEGKGVFLNASVRSGSDYGITEHIDNILQGKFTFNSLTVWGTPGDPSHNYQRCGRTVQSEATECDAPGVTGLTPFLTLPTACEGPQVVSIGMEPWALDGVQGPDDETSILSHEQAGVPTGFTGCGHLDFSPAIVAAPDTTYAETPAGLTVEVKARQEGLTDFEGLSMSNIKNTSVTLPEGMAINPGQAAGLEACPLSRDAVGTEGVPSCPNASRVGTDEIQTPLLAKPLTGSVYVLQSNPPNLKLLVAASGEGVNLKLVGDVHLDEKTGRLTTTFTETPELPFTLFKLAFSGGAQAALTTPPQCGWYTATSDFTPWSTPATPDVFPESEFAIGSGPGGSPCVSRLPFAPVMSAGATTDQAGGFTDFSMLLSRGDGQQHISRLQFKAPEGLTGELSKITLCEEPQAASGNCPSGSQIGHTTVEAGPGPYPLVVPQPSEPPAPIYLTGPYAGAPFGLSIVVPVVVGPFNLGTIVTRAKIEVDPLMAQLTITTDPLPQIVAGVPTDLRDIDAVIDRPQFMVNPTNCDASSFSGTATSAEGATAPLSSPFQVGSCRSLAFQPTFKVSTSAKTSRTQGASLSVTLDLPDEGGLGSEANVQKVKVSLPKQLPSPLKTLQKACLETVFAENPASCPIASQVGLVKVSTPLLSGPLTGKAYFVSHGGAKYPELIMVLVGEDGVTVQVHGETFISKAGITTATFAAVPDVPFSSFELTLPQREYPALTANGNLCKGTLLMPTEIAGQNGLVIKQNTKIAVTGCPKSKHIKHKQKHNNARGTGRKK
ncbi:MAG TPA: hypothetical protein VNV42_14970 [Solirubrobacteraceae bacterium]|nr:hypothetical protein [Solirubrobacteraceae bacterium]